MKILSTTLKKYIKSFSDMLIMIDQAQSGRTVDYEPLLHI